ncbi:hypothetical protein ZWY2020_013348 [Hordeum vulgare]|nr:hypothetical protein ZWY2020_013348 [Hordeum vulgare]
MPLTDHWRRALAVFPADYTLPIPLQHRPDYAASTSPLGRSRSPDYSPSASSWRPASPEYVPTAPWRRAASPQYAPPTRPERAATYPDRAPCPSPVVPADAGSRTSSRSRCYHPYQRSGVRTCTCSACRG